MNTNNPANQPLFLKKTEPNRATPNDASSMKENSKNLNKTKLQGSAEKNAMASGGTSGIQLVKLHTPLMKAYESAPAMKGLARFAKKNKNAIAVIAKYCFGFILQSIPFSFFPILCRISSRLQ